MPCSVAEADRRQDRDIEAVLAMYRAGDLPIGSLGGAVGKPE